MPAWPVVFRVHSLRRIGGAVAALCVAATVATIASANLDSPLLWIAHSQGVSRLNPEDATTLADRAVATGARAVAVDRERDRVWVLTEKELEFSNLAGLRLGTIRLEGSQGHPAALRLDPRSGVLWVGLHSRVHAIDGSAARVVAQHRLPAALSAIALDIDNGLLWVAASDTLYALNAEAAVVQSVRLAGVKRIAALDYAPALRQLWVVADDSLRLLAADGQASLVLRSPWLAGVHRVASDGASGLWAADRSTLAHLDRSGAVRLSLAPFAGFPSEKITDLAADAADGSVWVASTRRVIHLSADGAVLAQGEPQGADPATRLIAALLLEGGAPRLEFVAPANGSFLAQARPTFTLRFSGSGVDPDSLRFASGTTAVAMDCEIELDLATCTPQAAFVDGAHTLDAMIANAQRQRSKSAQLQFTIDTVAPRIEIVAPSEGLLTNQPQLTVSGRLSEPATLALNGEPVTVGADLAFSAGVTLTEGTNLLQLVAVDRAGNSGQAVLSVVLDTIAPPPALNGALSVQLLADGQVRVRGAAGSVEPGATVLVTNLRTGAQVSVIASADGTFAAELAATVGDALRIVVRDGAGNLSSSTDREVTAPPGSEPLQLSVTSPISGAVIASDTVLMTGTFRGPANAGVSVNGAPATLVPAGTEWNFFAEVPLELGGNELVVKATAPDGRAESRSITLLSTDIAHYDVQASPRRGFGPLTVDFRVGDVQMRGIVQISVDFDGNGTTDFVTQNPTQPISFTYGGLGLKTARFTVFDKSGLGHRQLVYIVLLDPARIDQTLRAVWAEFTAALAAGDRERALRLVTEDSRATYAGVFSALAPHMAEVLADFSEIEQVQIGADSGTYALMTPSRGQPRVYFVQFILDGDGIWRIDSL